MVPTALYKYLPSAKRYLTSFICRAVEGDYKLTKEDVEGNLVLIHKKGDATDPANYRPIALLNVDYKLLTKTVLELRRDAIPPTLIPKQQLARSNVSGTLHGLLIDKAATRGGNLRGREHHTAWYEFSKAFDSISHEILR